MHSNTEVVVVRRGENIGGRLPTACKADLALSRKVMTSILKASDWINVQLRTAMRPSAWNTMYALV